MRGSRGPVRFRLVVGLTALALVAAACGGGGDEETEDTVSLEEVEPIVEIDPCDLIDETDASTLAGAEVGEAESTTDDDGTTTCDFPFADEEVADDTGSAIAASLSIGPGSEDDVPTGSAVARSLSLGDRGAVEQVEDDESDKVRVVYIVQQVVVRVEVVPGDGEVDEELIDEVVEFTETTEEPVTEAVTGEDFVPDDDATTTTATTEPDEDPEPGEAIDDLTTTLTVDRAGGLDEATFEAPANSFAFIRLTAASDTDPSACLRLIVQHPDEFTVTGSGCIATDGSSFIDRTVFEDAGTYTLVFDPDGPATGSIEVELTSGTDQVSTIEVDGDTETATVTEAGAIHRVEFEADAGDAIFVSFPAATLDDPESCLRVLVMHPDDFTVSGTGCVAADGSTFLDRVELPDAGTYSLVLDPDADATGSVDIQLTAAN